MDLIHSPLSSPPRGVLEVLLPIDRQTLSKLRWRATAEDSREFGFDLTHPLHDQTPFFSVDGTTYVISQQPEPVFEIPVSTPATSARVAWLIGNLHFSLEIIGDIIRTPQDEALRQMLTREHIHFSEHTRVFHPFRPGHVH